MSQIDEAAHDVVQRSYSYLLRRELPGRWAARLVEFEGCEAYGGTAPEAIAALQVAAEKWARQALAASKTIPEPLVDDELFFKWQAGQGPWA